MVDQATMWISWEYSPVVVEVAVSVSVSVMVLVIVSCRVLC